jgi:DNA helicase-2/ATP-dependent DNA helicase PcrA
MVTPPPTDAARPGVAAHDVTAPDRVPAEVALPEVVGLERLHPEQRDAVTHGEGPLLVVAGAGTGKTQVVTHRIAWLISEKRARPEQILALTFTDKAAAEMESRVDLLVPYGLVGATLATFNAFCDRLVREHAVELGLTSRLRVEAQAEILVFLRERLFELGLERYLPLGQPDAHLQALTGLFDRARNEDVSPERYLEFARSLAAAAGDDPEKRDRAAAELEKAGAYAKYEALLMKAGRIDFSSQIRIALKLLRERAHVRREVQERWRWILVDEFQDTNHVQFELVRLLAGERRNLTVVGDDDQSIYRFRGARIENLLEFLDVYPDARQVILKRNHRSGQRILDDAHRLIRANDPWRLEAQRGWDKRLHAQRVDPATGDALAGSVQHRTFATGRDEAEWVAEEIAGAVAAGTARPGDFAVLARAHGHLDPFALALKSRGVRFRRVGMRGLYARPEVLLCLNALRSVADPDGGVVHQVLGDPLFGADPVDLARIGQRAKRTNRGFLRLALEAVNGPPRDGAGCAEITRVAVRRFATLHAALCDSAIRRPTSEVLYQFVTESGLLAALTAEESAESLERVQNLNKLFGIVARVGPLLKQDRVPAFIEHLDLLIEMGDDPAAAELETDEDAVSLLTAHGAKGLEFPVVYVVNLVEQRFPQFRRAEEMEFPPELKAGAHAAAPPPDPSADHYREERRLFYVGMTRARDRLVLTHAQDYGGKRATKVSRFINEALDLPAPPKGARGTSALESIARYAPVAEPAPAPIAPVPDGTPLTLSHAQIDDWLTCPLKYLFAHVAHVPLAGDPSFMYGNAIHHAIKIWHQHRIKGLPVEVEDVVGAFDSAWSSEGFLTREHEERMQEQGREALRRFVARDAAARATPLAVETDFKFKVGDDVVIGRWDRIDERAEGIVLVDYKSSEVDDAEKAESRAKDSLKDGQLGLYALAYYEARQVMPAAVELQFVGTGVVGAAVVKDEHLERARERVREAAAGIREARYPPKPDQRNCGYCSYRLFCAHSAAKRA